MTAVAILRLRDDPAKIQPMLLTLAIILILLWALGVLAFHVTAGLIHLLLLIALIVIIARLVTRRRRHVP